MPVYGYTYAAASSLELCLVADEGVADLYPRLALTSEWDTAAAQSLVEAASGSVVDSNFERLSYNQMAILSTCFSRYRR